MKYMRAMLLGAALVTSSATFAAAQAVVPVQWSWGHRDNDDRQAFRDGYRQGILDARQGRRADWDDRCPYRENDDRVAFRNGYTQGYREVGAGYRRGDGDGDADDGYRGGRGGYGGGYGNYGFNNARQYGYQDGYNDGLGDRNNGHSFRPTHDGNYKHADRGYDYRFGDRDQYKAAYRQAYEQGYQQGYNRSGGWGRR